MILFFYVKKVVTTYKNTSIVILEKIDFDLIGII